MERLTIAKFGMDHDRPDSFAACGPVSLAAREPLVEDLRQRAALVLPWEDGLYERRYPFMRPTARDAGAMADRIERARGPLSMELGGEMRAYLAGRP